MIHILLFFVGGRSVVMGGTVSTTSSNTTIMMIDHDENHDSSMILPNFPKYVVSGGNDVETEVLCPTGTYPINDSCVLCPKGTYNPFEGARDESFCMKCRAGSFNNQTGTFMTSTTNAVLS